LALSGPRSQRTEIARSRTVRDLSLHQRIGRSGRGDLRVSAWAIADATWMDKVMSAFRSGADEAHVAQSSERVTEAHTRLHRAGHVTGGRVFGYRNEDVFRGVDVHGRPLRSHVERVIDEREAETVRRIFTLYDSGLGLKAIAKQLKREGAEPPK